MPWSWISQPPKYDKQFLLFLSCETEIFCYMSIKGFNTLIESIMVIHFMNLHVSHIRNIFTTSRLTLTSKVPLPGTQFHTENYLLSLFIIYYISIFNQICLSVIHTSIIYCLSVYHLSSIISIFLSIIFIYITIYHLYVYHLSIVYLLLVSQSEHL